MGQHYNVLLELLDKGLVTDGEKINRKPVQEYISDVVKKSELMELSFQSPDVIDLLDKTDKQYDDFLKSFLKKSHRHYKAILMPHNITALEDEDSVVIVENKGLLSFNLINCCSGKPMHGVDDNEINLFCVELSLMPLSNNKMFTMGVNPVYNLIGNMKKGLETNLDKDMRVRISYDAVNAATAFIEQSAYLQHLKGKHTRD